MDIQEHAQQFRQWIEQTPDKTLLVTTHDRKCCDAMGAVLGLAAYAKSAYNKETICIFARPKSQPMSERLFAEIVAPKKIMVLGEELEEKGMLQKQLCQHTALFAVDTSSLQNSTYLPIMRQSVSHVYSLDHHAKGGADISQDTHAEIIRVEESQAASALLVHLLSENGFFPEDQETLIALYLGIVQDTQMIPKEQLSSLAKKALSLIETKLTAESKKKINSLKATPYPLQWHMIIQKAVPLMADTSFVLGLGIVDNPGIVAYVADHLLSAEKATTVIVIALAEEHVGKKSYRDIVASGRSRDARAVQLPQLFGEIFCKDYNGRKVPCGGGKITGKLASCAASIPLPEKENRATLWEQETKKIQESLHAWGILPQEMIFHHGNTPF